MLLLASTFVFLTMQPAIAKTLTIGTISASPVSEIETFKPFADLLARKLTHDGIDSVNIIIAADIPDLLQMIEDEEIDLYIDSSITALAVNEQSGTKFLVRRWKKGRPQYRSAIFVNADSSIQKIGDLYGNSIIFEESFSTSGFILPALTIEQEGGKLKTSVL